MTTATLTLSQTSLMELARKEVELAYQLGLGRMAQTATDRDDVPLVEKAIAKGLVLFHWECNPEGC